MNVFPGYHGRTITVLFSFLLFHLTGYANLNNAPSRLTINFLAHADQVFLNGNPVNTPLYKAAFSNENYQFTEIAQKRPFFGWIVNSEMANTTQKAYRILVASSLENIQNDIGDFWDSGKSENDQSINITYAGKALEPRSVYFWKVKTWDNHGIESPFSLISQFRTAVTMVDYATAFYPLQKQDEYPVLIRLQPDSLIFIDFGKDAFGSIRLTLYGNTVSDTVVVHLGEAEKEGRINRMPGGTIRYSSYMLALKPGWNKYIVVIRPDRLNTSQDAIHMPGYIGEVTPFRYCEIEGYHRSPDNNMIARETVFYPSDDEDSFFSSSDTILNQVWDLCKYSIKATSFTGMFIDGDRERIPYEADAYISQLGQYCVTSEYSLARNSHEYLLYHPTWPTEWIMQSVLMAWNDYFFTGNKESLDHFYIDLKAKSLLSLADETGLISTRKGKVTSDLLNSIHLNKKLNDIIDWPQTSDLEKFKTGETDGFVFQDINTVVNAFHYRALTLMSNIAGVVGEKTDERLFLLNAGKFKKEFNKRFLDKKKSLYVDGIGTHHASLHSNMFPVVFGLAPEKCVHEISDFICSRGMACSVYGSQFLLDALFDLNIPEYGLELLASTSDRSWYNMIRDGSTITMEAWDNKYKPNLDWNHAWGAVPANIIPRKLMGIEPLEPGFRKIRIKPQPASLEHADIKYPTIRGNVLVSFENKPGRSFILEFSIPANTSADVWMPHYSKTEILKLNGERVSGEIAGDFVILRNIGSGKNKVEVCAGQ